jgi:hypothetical protein
VGFLPIRNKKFLTEVNTGTLSSFGFSTLRMVCEKQITGLMILFGGKGKS